MIVGIIVAMLVLCILARVLLWSVPESMREHENVRKDAENEK